MPIWLIVYATVNSEACSKNDLKLSAVDFSKFDKETTLTGFLPNFSVYKYRVKPDPKMIPLDRGDIEIFKTIIRNIDKHTHHKEHGIFGRDNTGVYTFWGFTSYTDLQRCYEYSNDNGVTWRRAEKQSHEWFWT